MKKFTVDWKWCLLIGEALLAIAFLVVCFRASLAQSKAETLLYISDIFLILVMLGRFTVEAVLSFKWLPRG